MANRDLTSFLAGLRKVESGGNYRAHNPSGASGAYQFLDSTWAGYGGYRRAMDAPPAVQDRRAEQLAAQYYHRYHRWDLVAVAWFGGPGLADRVRADPGLLQRTGDGNITTGEYVRRVLAARPSAPSHPGAPSHPDAPSRPGDRPGQPDRHEVAPWRLPPHGAPLGGRVVAIDPDRLLALARQLTDHIALTEQVHLQCRAARAELHPRSHDTGSAGIEVADRHLEAALRSTLDEVLDDWNGLRRLPFLLSRDLGYVVDVRRRVLRADQADARHTIEGLIGTLATTYPRGTRQRTAALVRKLFPAHHPHPPHPQPQPQPQSPLDAVTLGHAWAGTESIFDQFVTPFLRRRGLRAGTEKWLNPNLASDHRPEHTTAYAIDYPTTSGLDDARALARAMGIHGWRPDTYQNHIIEVDGVKFRVQILWGARIDHADHVHVGIRRL